MSNDAKGNDPNIARDLNAFVDGELGLTRQLELEAALSADAALRDEVEGLRSLRAAVRNRADYHAAPEALRARLGMSASTGFSAATSSGGVPSRPGGVAGSSPLAGWRAWFAWRPMGSAFALVALLAWGIDLAVLQGGHDDRVMQEVIASHVRSTVGDRLVDVASSDQHTVKPWLGSKLDFSPPVGDVVMPNVSFVGGRVDYLDGRPVAALVYRLRKHVVDAYVWPAPGDAPMRTLSQRGFNVVHWTQGGMRFWVISDVQRDELATFARTLAQADSAR
jgi:anti-sigma factor RsiW